MKKLMMAAVALICMTMTVVSLTACGGDDDSSKPKDQIEYFVEGTLGYRIPDKTQADPVPESWGGILGKGIVVYGTVTVTKKSGSNVTEVWTKKYE